MNKGWHAPPDTDQWLPISIPSPTRPRLIVVVDTEEEFDWRAPFSREHRSVRSIARQPQMHRIFERYGITPTYLVDYPVVTQAAGLEPLRELVASGACLIGSHLHSWVNPPFEREPSERNSFPGNLPPELERRQLILLTEAIEQGLGVRPRIYKAGRYGLGPETFRTLGDTGYLVDMSAVPGADLRSKLGPDFRRVKAVPYWINGYGGVLEVPMSRGYVGLLANHGPRAEALLNQTFANRLRLGGLLSRTGLLDRIWLSPEGVTWRQQLRLLRQMLLRGQRVFTLTYHSPSLLPGSTPYVRSETDLSRFIDTIERVLDEFFGPLGGEASDPLRLRDELLELGNAEGAAAAAPSDNYLPRFASMELTPCRSAKV